MEQPPHVFVLSYARPLPDGNWVGVFIGVYSSLEQVEKVQQRLRSRLGYRDYPEGFRVDCYRLNEDYDPPEFMTEGS